MKHKPLPCDAEIEKTIVGALLSEESTTIENILLSLEEEWFTVPIYKTVVNLTFEMATNGEEINLMSFKNKLEHLNKLEEIGGLSGLVELTEWSFESKHWEKHCLLLHSLYKKRQIIKEARRMEENAFKSDDIDSDIITSFDNINRVMMEGGSKSTDVEDNIKLLEDYIALNQTTSLIGDSWGPNLEWLDKHTGGIRKGKTYRIGAPSGVGKSNLVYQMVASLLEQGKKVLFVSLENNIETTYIKLLSSVQGQNSRHIEKGTVKANTDWLRKYKDRFFLTDQLFELNDIKREVLKVKPDVVILDYIGLVNIKGCDEKTLYNVYADEIKQFVQKHQWLSWIDLSNLNKADDEETIRRFKGFNGAAKLRNNADVAIHMFDYAPFTDYKKIAYEDGKTDVQNNLRGKKVLTFFLSKNRMGNDNEEQQFVIDFDKGTRYIEATTHQKELWEAFC